MTPPPKKKAKRKIIAKKKPEAVPNELQRLRRQLEMEEALEIVRSKTLRWTTSAELADTSALLFQQLKRLGIFTLRTSLGIFDDANDAIELWLTSATDGEGVVKVLDYVNMHIHPVFENQLQARRKKKPFAVSTLRGKEVLDYYQNMSTYLSLPKHKTYNEVEHFYSFFFNEGSINIIVDKELAEEECEIMIRFANVFGLIYTRFLDLQKAEAQAHEAQVEAALERVRSRAMAMRASAELMDVADVLREQMALLGQPELETAAVHLYDEDPDVIHSWRAFRLGTNAKGQVAKGFMKIPKDSCAVVREWMENFEKRLPEYTIEVSGEKQDEWYDKVLFVIAPDIKEALWKSRHEPRFYHFTPFSGGALLMVAVSQPSEETAYLQRRAAVVFDLAYRRFLDLRNAEGQAREAKIEAALERVRASTMAMHKSEQLLETAQILFEQFGQLGKTPDRIGIGIIREEKEVLEWWVTNQKGTQTSHRFESSIQQPTIAQLFGAWKDHSESIVIDLEGAELKEWIRFVRDEVKMPIDDSHMKGKRVHHAAFFTHGLLLISSHDQLPEETMLLLIRFAKVFGQTYTRFLDLQKAEAQASEAQIEAALERVRSRSMAMHKSKELKEVIQIVYEQFIRLNIHIEHTGFVVDYKTSDDYHIWLADKVATPTQVTIPYFDCVYYNQFNEAKRNGTDFFVTRLSFEEKNIFYQDLFKHVPSLPKDSLPFLLTCPGLAISTVLLDNVCLYIENFSGIPYTEEENAVLMRFGRVFQQTYTRFLDLQKAEAQTREGQIQLAMERVRARTMAMQKSDELPEAANLLFLQVQSLGMPAWSAGYCIWDDDKQAITLWMSSEGVLQPPFKLPLTEDPSCIHFLEAHQRAEPFYVEEIGGEALVKHYSYMQSLPVVGEVLQSIMDAGHPLPVFQIFHCAYFSKGFLLFITYEPVPDAHDIFKRFGKVFDQTYTRFLDLQKAEAQAREAQIEAALERVRSRSLAMHKSDELAEVVGLIYQQFEDLDFGLHQILVSIFDKANKRIEWWSKGFMTQHLLPQRLLIPIIDHPFCNDLLEKWESGVTYYPHPLEGELKKSWDEYLFTQTDLKNFPQEVKDTMSGFESVFLSDVFMKYGSLQAAGPGPLPEEKAGILKRFAKVLDQAYTRMMDLQKAEAQAREAQIEAALERVRSKTMAMHNSEDVGTTVALMFDELVKLGIETNRCGILIFGEGNDTEVWTAKSSPDRQPSLIVGHLDVSIHPLLQEVKQAWISKQDSYVYELSGQNIEMYYRAINNHPGYPTQFDLNTIPALEIHNDYFFQEGAIFAFTSGTVAEVSAKIFKRFAGVFGQTYRRYLDLQQAESQAREARLEASLERVRGKAMGMHNSGDLTSTIKVFYQELESLHLKPLRCGVGLLNQNNRLVELSTISQGTDGTIMESTVSLTMEGHPVLEQIHENYLKQQEFHPVLRGNEIKKYNQAIRPQVDFPDFPVDAVTYGHFFYVEDYGVYAWTDKELSEDELKIYRRFTSVLTLTYKRYRELKDAEERARIAVRDASLDRVRAEIASMRHADDLQRITPLVWRELRTLGVPFFRCGVLIINEQTQKADYYLSTPEGQPLAALHLDFNTSLRVVQTALQHWREQKVYVDHWDKEQFITFARSMMELGQIQTMKSYQGGDQAPDEITLQFVPFSQGMLYVGSKDALSTEQINLMKALAEAFSTAYARYEDFTRLEAAKAQVENTLKDLRTTQTQLVQSEKMASLGELTAGIAHEIQNPLNFVNNFSEVSKELLDEMEEELKKGNANDAKQIARSVIENLEKINFHGKRADGIVKSMLQHSRKSTGQKELTDINALCDEYLRLSYHGLRAKDKSFNAKFESDLDPNVGQVLVLPQEIGRVVLNLINNAFYAVSEKKKLNLNGYEPTVTVSTKKSGAKIEIHVKDNGTGIPQKALDKIFNPFFTTKPTGQGTGLGLSLSYDIVKAHGGEIKVETKEGEGSVLTIILPA